MASYREGIAGIGHVGPGKLDGHVLVRAVGALRRRLSPEPEVGGSHPGLAQEGQPTLGVRRVSQEVQADVVFVAERVGTTGAVRAPAHMRTPVTGRARSRRFGARCLRPWPSAAQTGVRKHERTRPTRGRPRNVRSRSRAPLPRRRAAQSAPRSSFSSGASRTSATTSAA